ncbi:glycoside hydrolase family 2 TIM barrel-domain containing protein [Sphingomonas pokkalii]|nr:glycoside hydrolase family 2 TIM barrel-domain containing protein [Sphingomonas pokkalii]
MLKRSAVASALLCSAALLAQQAVAQPQAPTARQAPSTEPRAVLDLSKGWRFHFGDAGDAPAAPDFEDSAWQPVAVPHTWNKVGTYAVQRAADSDMRQGKGWYRCSFAVPAALNGRRLFLEFDGVSKIADIWVNGRHVGSHAGAFGRFRIDVTGAVRPGDNSLAVRADNSASAPGSSTEHVIPLGGDFFVQGGIYRGVRLLAVDAAHIDLADHGGPGVYLRTSRVSAERAEVAAKTLLRNLGTRRRTLTLVTTVQDAGGTPVATDRAPVALAPGQASTVERALTVATPHLWQGRADPYLYRVVSELRDGSRVIDRQVQPLGIRSFAFDAERGFLLNGKVTPLHGVSRHQDVQGKGWALTPEDHASDMAFAVEIGANTIRHAHYQHAQEWSDEADRAGMVVWAELPFVHEANVEPSEAPAAATIANAEEQLRELIRQNYNHPSIMLWSVGNEADIGAAIDAMRKGDGKPAQSRAMLEKLDRLARAEDTSRPTVYADCCEDTPSILSMQGAPSLNGITQVMGLNRYYGWYYGDLGGVGPALDALHAKHPTLPIGLSEWGAGGAMTQHSDNPRGGPVAAYGRPQPEEYQSLAIEENWKQIRTRPYLAASWLWNLFDFATTMRNEGDATDVNTKGLVSYDRKTRKDAFYFLKASWSDAPTLHLNGRRYVDRAYTVTDVRGYSNADRVSLSLNGKPVGEVTCPDRICVWPGVALTPGANHLVATATIGGKQISDALDWNAPDPRKGVFIDSGALVGSTMGGDSYGSDAFFRGGTGKVISAGRNPMAVPPKVEGTDMPALFGSYREGRFGYDIPLPDGSWTITIASLEPDATKGAARSFTVLANGQRVIESFAPMQAAGGANKAVTRSFAVKSSGGRLVLDFEPVGGDAVVAGIAIRPN